MNLVDPILFQCRWQPMALALFAPKTMFNSVTYGQLEKYIHNIGRKAMECGLGRGKVAALFIKDPILHGLLFLGLTKIGVVTVSAQEAKLPRELTIDALLVEPTDKLHATAPAIAVDKSWIEGPGRPLGDGGTSDARNDEPCRIVLTSGSTGEAKAILRTNRHATTSVHRWQLAFGSRLSEASRIFLDLGLSSGVGMTCLTYILWKGGTAFMRGDQPIEALGALSTFRVRAMITGPRSLAEFTDLCEKIPSFRSYLDLVVTLGSRLPRSLADRARSRLCSNLVSCYGSTEASVAATAPVSMLPAMDGAVGYAVPGVSVDIVGPSGAPLPAEREGLVRIRSSELADGYIGDPETTRLRFRDGGFYPGDIGIMTADGVLVIRGREEAIINLGGDKISPERVEAALGSFPAVKEAAALAAWANSDVQILVAAVVWQKETDKDGLLDHLRRQLPAVFIPKLVITVDSIPRNSAGKIDRQGLKELIAQRTAQGS